MVLAHILPTFCPDAWPGMQISHRLILQLLGPRLKHCRDRGSTRFRIKAKRGEGGIQILPAGVVGFSGSRFARLVVVSARSRRSLHSPCLQRGHGLRSAQNRAALASIDRALMPNGPLASAMGCCLREMRKALVESSREGRCRLGGAQVPRGPRLAARLRERLLEGPRPALATRRRRLHCDPDALQLPHDPWCALRPGEVAARKRGRSV